MNLDTLLGPLDDIALTAFGVPTTWGEIAGFLTGAACVWLVARQHVGSWPVGMTNNVLFLVLFAAAGLYADAGLQVVYLLLAGYGWWSWLYAGEDRSRLEVSRTSRPEWTAMVAAGVLGLVALWAVLEHATDSTVAGADAATTVLSLAATWGQCRKKVESWWLWIAADLAYIPLYASKGLGLTALLYLVFLGLCLQGLRAWRTALSEGVAVLPLPVGARP